MSASDDIWILGIHMTKFGKHPDLDTVDLGAQAIFQMPDAHGKGGLGHAAIRRGTGEMLVPDKGAEELQVTKIEHWGCLGDWWCDLNALEGGAFRAFLRKATRRPPPWPARNAPPADGRAPHFFFCHPNRPGSSWRTAVSSSSGGHPAIRSAVSWLAAGELCMP